ncbi:MAG: glycosyltransferase family 2 protein [Prevotella sp.]|nr:glycosyltransferase family 2 protein [Prevotella sp.]
MTSETIIRLDALIYGTRVRNKIRSELLRKVVRLFYYPLDIVWGLPKMWSIIRKMKCGNPETRPINLAVVAIGKNESEYIAEWVAYHKAVGVERIYLYDNDSTDGMKNCIQKFIDDGYVIYNQIHGVGQQFPAYCKGLWDYGRECRYMAFIDCDEFLTPVRYDDRITDLLDDLFAKNPKAGGVLVNWCMYASSHLEKKPEGLLIDNFIYRANIGKQGTNVTKTIIRPECTLMWDHPHYPVYRIGYYGIDTSGRRNDSFWNEIEKYTLLQVNHYFTKSREQWIKRRAQGKADLGADDTRTLDEFYAHDNNDVIDESAKKYSNQVKDILNG